MLGRSGSIPCRRVLLWLCRAGFSCTPAECISRERASPAPTVNPYRTFLALETIPLPPSPSLSPTSLILKTESHHTQKEFKSVDL